MYRKRGTEGGIERKRQIKNRSQFVPVFRFFAQWELPNLKAGEVSEANILLVHTPGHAVK